MTAPNVAVQDPVAAELAKIRGQAPSDPVADELARIRGTDAADPMQTFHTLYAKHLLDSIERGTSADEQSALPTKTGAVLETLETPLAGVPGGALAMSAARKLVNPSQSFASTQADVNHGTSDTNASWLGRGIGGIAAQGLLPGATAAKAGAVMEGADQLLNNDPHSGAVSRIARMMGGTIAGYGAGKVADMALAGGRALLAKGGEAAKDAALAGRSEVAGPLYDAVRDAPVKELTPDMTAMLQDPDVAPIVEKLQTLRQYRGVPPNDPKFLMAVRKNLSDWGKELMKKGNVLDPNKPNMVADLAEHVGKLTDAFDAAADTQVPNFSKAVQTFADQSVPVNAQEAGYDALRRKMTGGLTTWKNIGKKTAGSFADQIDRATPELTAKAGEEGATGVLAAIRDATKQGGIRSGLNALSSAPSLLQTADQAAAKGLPAWAQGTPLPSAIQRALLALAQSGMTPGASR